MLSLFPNPFHPELHGKLAWQPEFLQRCIYMLLISLSFEVFCKAYSRIFDSSIRDYFHYYFFNLRQSSYNICDTFEGINNAKSD